MSHLFEDAIDEMTSGTDHISDHYSHISGFDIQSRAPFREVRKNGDQELTPDDSEEEEEDQLDEIVNEREFMFDAYMGKKKTKTTKNMAEMAQVLDAQRVVLGTVDAQLGNMDQGFQFSVEAQELRLRERASILSRVDHPSAHSSIKKLNHWVVMRTLDALTDDDNMEIDMEYLGG